MAKISGNLSNDARIIVVNESNWLLESYSTHSTGNFDILNLAAGQKTVIGRTTNGECAGYGDVTPVTEEV